MVGFSAGGCFVRAFPVRRAARAGQIAGLHIALATRACFSPPTRCRMWCGVACAGCVLSQPFVGSSSSSAVSSGSSLPDLSAALKPSRHGSSYAHLLAEARQQQQQQHDGVDSEQLAASMEEWQQLDDPNIQSGKHRVVLPLPGLLSSVVSFVRGKELKQQLNAQFRQKVSRRRTRLSQRACTAPRTTWHCRL